MTTALFQQQRAAQQVAFAEHIGCSVADLQASDRLTVRDRPVEVAWAYTAYAITWGTGTVVSAAPGYREAVERLAAVHSHPLHPPFLQAVVEEARRRGQQGSAPGAGLGWALSEVPAPVAAPAGFSLRVEDASWMNAEMASGRWPNSLGGGSDGEAGRPARNRYAAVLRDGEDAPVAIAGVLETWGLAEIGVDVTPAYQGRGFGRLVVQASTRAIVESGRTALYGCDLDNLRSQRTALASGFLPSYAYGYVAG